MTDKTTTIGVRIPVELKPYIKEYMTRERLVEIGEMLRSGSVPSVNTCDGGVNTCDNCPYFDDLDMSKFNEVCEFKGLDRQQAIDKCASMLWR